MKDSKDYQLIRHQQWLMVGLTVLVCVWVVFNVFWGEHISANNGLGYDGVTYAKIARDFPNLILHHGLTNYYVQRSLPPAIVYFASHFVGWSLLPDAHVIRAFQVYNAFILLASFLLLCRFSVKQNWSNNIRIIAFSSLFINHGVISYLLFYPILTDMTAMFFGLLVFYCYFNNNMLALLISTIIGAFVFPTIIYIGLVLYVFQHKGGAQSLLVAAKPWRNIMFSGLVSATIVLYTIAINHFHHYPSRLQGRILGLYATSLGALFIYNVFAFYHLVDLKYLISSFIKQVRVRRLLFSIAVIAGIKWLAIALSDGKTTFTLNQFSIYIALGSISKPLVFLVGHIVTYGPVVLLLMMYWNEICRYVKQNGFGLLMAFVLLILVSRDAESRQLVNFLPLVVLVVAEVLRNKKITINFVYMYLLVGFILSWIWVPWYWYPKFILICLHYFRTFFQKQAVGMNLISYINSACMALFFGWILWFSKNRPIFNRQLANEK